MVRVRGRVRMQRFTTRKRVFCDDFFCNDLKTVLDDVFSPNVNSGVNVQGLVMETVGECSEIRENPNHEVTFCHPNAFEVLETMGKENDDQLKEQKEERRTKGILLKITLKGFSLTRKRVKQILNLIKFINCCQNKFTLMTQFERVAGQREIYKNMFTTNNFF